MRGPVLGASAAALLVAVGLAIPLTRSEPQLLATNGHPNLGPAVVLAAGTEACQSLEDLPAEARSVVFPASAAVQAGPVEVAYRREGLTLATGRSDGVRSGAIQVPITPPPVDALAVDLCVRNAGSVPISIGGSPAGDARERQGSYANLEQPAVVDGAAQLGRMRVEYPLPGQPSPAALAGRVAERAGMLKASPIDAWAIWAALLLTVVAGVLGVTAVGRAER